MTAQFPDLFLYGGKEYAVSGIGEGEVFDVPALLGQEPIENCTACYRGYMAYYAVVDSHLVLDMLDVNLTAPDESDFTGKRQLGPVMNGVAPEPLGPRNLFNSRYSRLHHSIPYSGGLLLTDGFIERLHEHMGFQQPWKYTTVIELIFESGALKEEHDRSTQMAVVRETLLKKTVARLRREMPRRERKAPVDQLLQRLKRETPGPEQRAPTDWITQWTKIETSSDMIRRVFERTYVPFPPE